MGDEWNEKMDHLRESYHRRIEMMDEYGGLRSWILYVLNEGPKNGVEIMDAIQEMNDRRRGMLRGHHGPERRGPGAWRPSPGSIYPMLGKMTTTGLITKKEDGRYELTETGCGAFDRIFGQPEARADSLEKGPYSIENVLREMDGYASYLEDIKKEKLAPHAGEIDAVIEKLARVRETLRR